MEETQIRGRIKKSLGVGDLPYEASFAPIAGGSGGSEQISAACDKPIKATDTHRHLKLPGFPMALCWREVDRGHSVIQICMGRHQSDLDLCEREHAERQRQAAIDAMARVAKLHARDGQGGPRRV
jgi:hypothetical protein